MLIASRISLKRTPLSPLSNEIKCVALTPSESAVIIKYQDISYFILLSVLLGTQGAYDSLHLPAKLQVNHYYSIRPYIASYCWNLIFIWDAMKENHDNHLQPKRGMSAPPCFDLQLYRYIYASIYAVYLNKKSFFRFNISMKHEILDRNTRYSIPKWKHDSCNAKHRFCFYLLDLL